MNAIDWSKAPPHATHWCPGNAKIEAGWIYNPGGTKGEFYSCYADRGLEHIPAFPDWRKSRLVQRPPKQSWVGEGLPPVGVVCEIAGSSEYFHNRHPEGVEVKIYAHFTDDRGVELAAFTDGIGQVGGVGIAKCFRPIRTPEQIEAQARTEAIDDMIKALGMDNAGTAEYIRCGLIYDAGYRKQVMP
jgi:hypothetical protein